jgi:hypothetical protein
VIPLVHDDADDEETRWSSLLQSVDDTDGDDAILKSGWDYISKGVHGNKDIRSDDLYHERDLG